MKAWPYFRVPLKIYIMPFNFTRTSIGRFRMVAIIEGISYLFLLFIAMPLKYFANMPEVVKYTGWVHGILFMLYILTLINAKFDANWGFKKVFIAFICSLLPFATFILDKTLRKDELAFVNKSKAK